MDSFFLEALDLREHPLKKSKKKIRTDYITVLLYIADRIKKTCVAQSKEVQYITKRLYLYRDELFADIPSVNVDEEHWKKCVSVFTMPWRNKYRYMLICDIALIFFEDNLLLQAVEMVKLRLSARQQAEVEQIYSLLHSTREVPKKYLPALPLLNQFRANKVFLSKEERRIIVTANMSAGKSTLINALAGKAIARTSQEACTGNVCFLFNKGFEDKNIHLSAHELSLNATSVQLHEYDWNGHIFIASYFTGIVPEVPRLCIIDTPGVDAALYREHSKRAHSALLNSNYDTIIYVASPTRLGTDAEKKHLQWVFKNLQGKKVIFVLNKLDDYSSFSDSIEESVKNFKEDLLKIGFIEPVVCPISAYFSYLIKLRMTGQVLSEDEADEYALYSKKFMKPSYDLSCYYEGVNSLPTDSEEIKLSKRAGLYGLEKTIYGGGL